MGGRHISIGVVIAIILLVYWYMHDHPDAFSPAKQGSLYTISSVA